VVAACSSGDSSSSAGSGSGSVASSPASAPADGAAASATITIKDFRFGSPLTVAPGTEITVTNEDTAGHDVVSDDDGKFKTPTLEQGDSATFTAPTEPGTYKFSCSLHANMTGIGTLIVQG
jgi:plastocyanin